MNDNLLEKIPLRQHLKNLRTILAYTINMDKTYFALVWIVHLFNVIVPYLSLILSSFVLDSLSAGKNFREIFTVVAGIIILIASIHAVQSFLWSILEVRKERMLALYSCATEEHMLKMDYSRIDSPDVKALKEQIQRDRNWGGGLGSIFWNINLFMFYLFHLIAAIVVGAPIVIHLISYGNQPAWTVLLLLVIILPVSHKCQKYFRDKTNEFMHRPRTEEENKQFQSFGWDFTVGDGYDYKNGKDVRIYNSYNLMKRWTADHLKHPLYRKQLLRGAMGRAGESCLYGLNDGLLSGGSYLIIALLAAGGSMSIGSVVMFAGALSNLMTYLNEFISCIIHLTVGCRCQMSTFDFLGVKDEMYKGKLPLEKRSDNQYQIEFCNVSFRYPGSEQYALRNVSLKFTIGEKLAIVGMNGSGKTTLIKLLCRLYDPTEGEILLNGVNIRKFRHDEYNKLFAIVFQDYSLFPFMLAQNVAVDLNYDANRVNSCLCNAGFNPDSHALPHGIESFLYKNYDENGIEISGGEAQKIAIARAMYKNAPFILLDEPTAALDPMAEYQIYTGFERIIGDKTAVYISHRLSSCRFCEKIAVFHEGQLVQLGSHQQLLADTTGKYHEMWHAQAQYYQET